MDKVILIAIRDFRQTVLTKTFLFGVIGVPLLLVVASGLAGLLMASQTKPPVEGQIVVVTSDIAVTERIRLAMERDPMREDSRPAAPGEHRPGGDDQSFSPEATARSLLGDRIGVIEVTHREAQDTARAPDSPLPDLPADLREKLQHALILAVAEIPESATDPQRAGDRPEYRLSIAQGIDSETAGVIERRIGHALADVRAARAGTDADAMRALLRAPRARTSRMLPSGELRSEDQLVRMVRQFIIPVAFAFLVWGATLGTGQHLLMSTIEEKSNRVMEVLLSAVSPTQILAGKILGQSLVGLIVVTVYSGLGILALIAAARADLVQPIQLVYLLVYFLLAYLMIASLMAAVGSAVSDIREANSLLTPVMMLLMIPMMLWLPISRAPNGAVALISSFVPPIGPFTMILRVTAEEPIPVWQIPATMLAGALYVAAMIWMAGRIFRIGVLLTGKPPSPAELLRWIRTP